MQTYPGSDDIGWTPSARWPPNAHCTMRTSYNRIYFYKCMTHHSIISILTSSIPLCHPPLDSYPFNRVHPSFLHPAVVFTRCRSSCAYNAVPYREAFSDWVLRHSYLSALYLRVLLYNHPVITHCIHLGPRGNWATSLGNIRRKMPYHSSLNYCKVNAIHMHLLRVPGLCLRSSLSVDDGVTCFCLEMDPRLHSLHLKDSTSQTDIHLWISA